MPSLNPQPSAAIDRTVRRYRGASRFGQGYIAGKLRLDPLYRALGRLPAPKFGDIVDVGCGRGQLGILLLEAGAARSVIALDVQPSLLAEAEQAASDLPYTGTLADLTQSQDVPAADTIFLIDVLYQLDTTMQRRVLAAAAAAARRRIVIRTGDPARGWRSIVTRGLERIGRRIWPHSGVHVNALPVAAIAGMLTDAGFAVTVAPCWRGTPFCNVLLDARRGTAGTGTQPAAT